MFKNFMKPKLEKDHDKLNNILSGVFKQLPARGGKQPYKLGKTFERPDAFVWFIDAAADAPVTGGIVDTVPPMINQQLALAEFRHRAVAYQMPLRIEVKKPVPDSVLMIDEWEEIAALPQNKFLFVAGNAYNLYKSELLVLSMASEAVAQVLVAGTTGSGKTVAGMSILETLALLNSPSVLSLVIIDPKRVDIESSAIADLPHLAYPVISNIDQAIVALRLIVKEMERRSSTMDELRAQKKGFIVTDRIVVYVEEVADLVDRDASITEDLTRIAQLGRGLGVHLILSTQRPTVDVLPGRLKANLPCKIVLRVDSASESNIATGKSDTLAHTLAGKGCAYLFYGGNPDATGTFIRCLHSRRNNETGEWPDVAKCVADIQKRWHGAKPAFQLVPGNPVREAVEGDDKEVVYAADEVTDKRFASNTTEIVEACLAEAKDIADAQQFNLQFSLNKISDIAQRVTGSSVGKQRAKKIKAQLADILGYAGHGVFSN